MTDSELLDRIKKIQSDYPIECLEYRKIQAQIEKLESKLAK